MSEMQSSRQHAKLQELHEESMQTLHRGRGEAATGARIKRRPSVETGGKSEKSTSSTRNVESTA